MVTTRSNFNFELLRGDCTTQLIKLNMATTPNFNNLVQRRRSRSHVLPPISNLDCWSCVVRRFCAAPAPSQAVTRTICLNSCFETRRGLF